MLQRNELLRIVFEDLKYLGEQWDASIEEASLRISSPVLRRLLVHGQLRRAWKATGFIKEPQIRAPSSADSR